MPVSLDYLSVARFNGPEAAAFLQNQLSSDIAALQTDDAGFACYCTPRGQVLALLLVCRRREDFLVAGSAALLPQVLSRLKMFVIRTKVEFTLEEPTTVHGLGGGETFTGQVFQPAGLDLRYGISAETPAGDNSSESFRALEISRGVTWLGPETSEKFIPQMLGFDQIGAVSFSKGCYPGQEIVARARYLGKVKRKPAIVRTLEPLAATPGERVELLRGGDWSKGVVVDSASAESGTVLMAVAPHAPDAETVELKYADRTYRCATT